MISEQPNFPASESSVSQASRDDAESDPTNPSAAGKGPEGFRWNIPNTLGLIRLLGAPVLVGVTFVGSPVLLLICFLAFAFTDLIDGRLAVWLKQRSRFGAALDSVADAALFAAMLFGCVWLKHELIYQEIFWLLAALGCWVVSLTAAVIRFGKGPSYHTFSAKLSWLFVVPAILTLLAWDWVFPLRIAMVAVAIANAEALFITLNLDRWRTDVHTLWHALKAPDS